MSSRVILGIEGKMVGWMSEWVGVKYRPDAGEGGEGQAVQLGGAPLIIPIDWLINL